jgi:hypothetical protein
MQAMTKIALISASVLSMGALTACQSTSNVPNNDHSHMMKHHKGKKQHLTPEQREQLKAKRAERMQFAKQLQQACNNKAVGSAVQIKTGDKTIDGTCKMVFKADRKEMKSHRGMKAEHHPMRADMRRGMMHGEVLTDAKRAELNKQFDQRLAQHQAHQQAMLQACQGKKDGTAAQIKMGEQTINGKCHVRFQPTASPY